MKNRRKKRQRIMNRRAMERSPARLDFTAEEQAWLNITPVGREFGSKDFENYVWTSDGTAKLKGSNSDSI